MIEACEYKRSFLAYHPAITVITNIDLDHLDYYRDMDDYRDAFQTLVNQTREYVIISTDDKESQRLSIPPEKKILVGEDLQGRGYISYTTTTQDLISNTISFESKTLSIPFLQLQIPGDHVRHDAHLAYATGKLLGMDDELLVRGLEGYQGAWRRSEIIGCTQ